MAWDLDAMVNNHQKKVPLGHVAHQTEARCEGLWMVYKVCASQLMISRIDQGHIHGQTSSCYPFPPLPLLANSIDVFENRFLHNNIIITRLHHLFIRWSQ